MRSNNNIVIFDLDETLGYFVEFGIFIDCLEEIYKNKINDNEFFKILDLYPEFIRPYMMKILNYIINKKKEGKCHKIMIYTNNQGERTWVENIKNYFNYKLKYNVFDKIIAAFKVDGKKIELNRTTHNKTLDDLFRCVKLPSNVSICFVDDQYHEDMIDNNVYYIKIEPYKYDLNFNTIIERYVLYKNINNINNNDFYSQMNFIYNKYNYKVVEKTIDSYKLDKIVSKKLFLHIKNFFKDNKNSKNNTMKKYLENNNKNVKTLKNHN